MKKLLSAVLAALIVSAGVMPVYAAAESAGSIAVEAPQNENEAGTAEAAAQSVTAAGTAEAEFQTGTGPVQGDGRMSLIQPAEPADAFGIAMQNYLSHAHSSFAISAPRRALLYTS